MDGHKWSEGLKITTHCGVSLLELSPEKGESIADWLANIYSSNVSWRCSCDTPQPIYETIYSRNFRYNNLREVVSEVDIRIALRK